MRETTERAWLEARVEGQQSTGDDQAEAVGCGTKIQRSRRVDGVAARQGVKG